MALSTYLFFKEPNIAQSIIIGAIAALVGFRAYLESLVKPDYEKLFTERLNAKDVEVNSILADFHKEVKEVKDGQNKLAIVQKAEDKINSFKW